MALLGTLLFYRMTRRLVSWRTLGAVSHTKSAWSAQSVPVIVKLGTFVVILNPSDLLGQGPVPVVTFNRGLDHRRSNLPCPRSYFVNRETRAPMVSERSRFSSFHVLAFLFVDRADCRVSAGFRRGSNVSGRAPPRVVSWLCSEQLQTGAVWRGQRSLASRGSKANSRAPAKKRRTTSGKCVASA